MDEKARSRLEAVIVELSRAEQDAPGQSSLQRDAMDLVLHELREPLTGSATRLLAELLEMRSEI